MTKLWHCNQIIVVLAINTTLRQRVLPTARRRLMLRSTRPTNKFRRGGFLVNNLYHAKQLPVWKLCHA
jgi:hypothetical protein